MHHLNHKNLVTTASPAGASERWAETWAMDSVQAARAAHQSLAINGNPHGKFMVSWKASLHTMPDALLSLYGK
jgi:hypothetical protein